MRERGKCLHNSEVGMKRDRENQFCMKENKTKCRMYGRKRETLMKESMVGKKDLMKG